MFVVVDLLRVVGSSSYQNTGLSSYSRLYSDSLHLSVSSFKTDWVILRCFRRCCDANYFYPLAAVFSRARWRRPSIQFRSVAVTLVAFLKLNQYKLCLLNGIMDFFSAP